MTQIIPLRPGVPLRELMCGKHERPATSAALLDEAVRRVSDRIGCMSVLPARRHLAIWLAAPWIIPINSIRSAYRSLS